MNLVTQLFQLNSEITSPNIIQVYPELLPEETKAREDGQVFTISIVIISINISIIVIIISILVILIIMIISISVSLTVMIISISVIMIMVIILVILIVIMTIMMIAIVAGSILQRSSIQPNGSDDAQSVEVLWRKPPVQVNIFIYEYMMIYDE